MYLTGPFDDQLGQTDRNRKSMFIRQNVIRDLDLLMRPSKYARITLLKVNFYRENRRLLSSRYPLFDGRLSMSYSKWVWENRMTSYKTLVGSSLIWILTVGSGGLDVYATNVVQVPISTAAHETNEDGINTIVMSWDQSTTPDPLLLQWGRSRVPVRGDALEPLMEAFDYAMAHYSTTNRPTGTLSLYEAFSSPVGNEGPSAGAALAVGFLAVLRGDQLTKGITITGELESTGRIGLVRNIGENIRAAARQGYRVLLIPRGQMHGSRVTLVGIGVEPNVVLREVETIDEAYEIMTGKKL